LSHIIDFEAKISNTETEASSNKERRAIIIIDKKQLLTNTVVHPWAVMVKLGHTAIAD